MPFQSHKLDAVYSARGQLNTLRYAEDKESRAELLADRYFDKAFEVNSDNTSPIGGLVRPSIWGSAGIPITIWAHDGVVSDMLYRENGIAKMRGGSFRVVG